LRDRARDRRRPRRNTLYSPDGDAVVTPISYEGLPPVADDFNSATLRADILDSQRNGQKQACSPKRGLAQDSPPARGMPPVVDSGWSAPPPTTRDFFV